MGMSEFYGRGDETESIATIHRALDLGVNFLDTADMYGIGRNEELVGRALRGRREQAILATKFGNVRGPNGEFLGVSGRPQYVRDACEASLKPISRSRSSTSITSIEWTPPRRSRRPSAPWLNWCEAGKVRYLGLSEAAPATLRRARAVHPIAALQTEYSLWSRDPEDGILAACRESGHGLRRLQPARDGAS